MNNTQTDKIQLKLFNDETELPTGKNHVSFSEISNHLECSYRHKLLYIDKLDKDGSSVHTAFGHVLHSALEEYTLTKSMPHMDDLIKDFQKRIGELFFTENAISKETADEFIKIIPEILKQVPKFLDKEFPGWKIISAEDYLFEPIPNQINKYFKGFIDLVIKVPKVVKRSSSLRLSSMKGEVVPGEWEYLILDWKTTGTGWTKQQKESFVKRMQLVLYKFFWSKKTQIDADKINCAFIFLRREASKTGNRVEILSIESGQKELDQALLTLNSSINQIQSKMFIKNKYSCRFCAFAGTKYCP